MRRLFILVAALAVLLVVLRILLGVVDAVEYYTYSLTQTVQAVLRPAGKVLAAGAWILTPNLLVPAAMIAVIAVLTTRDAVHIRSEIRREGADAN